MTTPTWHRTGVRALGPGRYGPLTILSGSLISHDSPYRRWRPGDAPTPAADRRTP